MREILMQINFFEASIEEQKEDISILQNNLNFLAAVHPENDFGTFYESFDKIKFKKYQKRKD